MPKKKEGVARSPYVHHIVATLEERIRTGIYPGGRWLPTERELCSEFAVSRAILRQALIELERNSLVIRAAGCRPFVKTDVGPANHRRDTARYNLGLCLKHDPKYSGTYLITQGVRQVLDDDTYRLVIADSNAVTLNAVAAEEAEALLRMVRDEDIAGIILWYCGGDANLPVLQAVQAAHIPMIFVDRVPPEGIEADYVSIDNQRAARQAVDYLISLGHRHIAHVTNPEPVSTVYERMAGYYEALDAAGIARNEALVLTGQLEGMAEEGLNAGDIVERLLRLPTPPTALFAVTDYIALAVVRALQERGLSVPADLAVIGFDDLEQWFPQKPFLTTVQQPFERIGGEAANILIRRLNGSPTHRVRHVLLEASLVVRDST